MTLSASELAAMTVTPSPTRWRVAAVLLLSGALLVAPSVVLAQGPLTDGFGDSESTTFAFRIGPLLVTPGLTVREIGVDTNVFDEPVDPKRDFTATVSPDLRFFMRVGLIRFTASSAADFTYYREYADERGISRQLRARTDLLLGRVQPWVAAAFVQTRDRPNAELDRRARRHGLEYSGGLNLEISPRSSVFIATARTETKFREFEVFQGVDLATALNRESEIIDGGLRTSLTPFTTLTLRGGVQRDRFVHAPLRNSDSTVVSAQLDIAPDAIIRGRARIGYREFDPVDPSMEGHRGVVGLLSVGFSALGAARFDVAGTRDVEYSFEESDGYFVQTGLAFTYTQRLGGPWDVQGRAGRSWLDYRLSARSPDARNEHVDTYAAGVGYNLQDRSRIGLSYEYAERSAPTRADRRYDRRRIFGSWTYEF